MRAGSSKLPFRVGHPVTWVLVLAALLGAGRSGAAITNVAVVNITPSCFSVVWAGPASGTPAISVFTDSAGATNLAGEVGIEFFPSHTGDPGSANPYQRRLDQAQLRQKSLSRGLFHVRISGCRPETTYYYRLQTTSLGGQEGVVWPAVGPLPTVKTASENAFVVQSHQLIFNLPGLDPTGSIVILSNSNTPSLLAAVAGDGVSSNQVYFSLSDLIAATGNTNYVPVGAQEFTASVLASSSNVLAQTYSLGFTTDWLIGQANLVELGNYMVLGIGAASLRAGESVSLPITLNASSITNVAFLLDLPTDRFRSLSLQAVSPLSYSASLQPISSNTVRVELAALPGQTLQGNRQVALLNFVTASNQSSAFVPVSPRALRGLNFDGTPVNVLAARAGRLVIVGEEPLLEALRASGGNRSLALYGKPWASYAIEYTTDLSNPAWIHLLRTPMTNLVQVFSGLDTNPALILYRAYEFAPDPPLLEAGRVALNRSLLVYGRAGTNYSLQYATNLSGVVAWYPQLRFTLTNSFQHLTTPGGAEPRMFYRIERP